jgi:hypothetical protein
MRGLKVNGGGEHRQRISDELRQLKQMSKGLRTKALRTLLERHAAERLEPEPIVVLPAKAARSVAA